MQDLVIDWSKAPEGATHYLPERNKLHHPVWLKIEGGTVLRVGHIGSDEWSFEYSPDSQPCLDLSRAIPRPAPSWSGEGLPPVGVVCEVIDWLSNEFTKQFNGKQVEIVAHSKDENLETAVFKVIGFLRDEQARYHSLVASCFKPIRTPEQIAADERRKAIDEMVKSLGMDDPGTAEYIRCGLIYDAGFRKEQK